MDTDLIAEAKPTADEHGLSRMKNRNKFIGKFPVRNGTETLLAMMRLLHHSDGRSGFAQHIKSYKSNGSYCRIGHETDQIESFDSLMTALSN